MLKDLKLSQTISGIGNSGSNKQISGNVSTGNAQIACAIVRIIFKNVNSCIQGDRSKVKLNMFEKGVIGGMVNNRVINGINNYVENMSEADLNILLTEIDKELDKRKGEK